MRYEKKMLILSGEGKGVVLIEKSGLGVRFALRTFGLRRGTVKKAGIVTNADVVVRDLPDTDDPSLVFYLDGAETDNIHFAVFDRELLLYGTNGKRMWEANLMGLFAAHDRTSAATPALPSRLPPLVEKPKVLPLPDGTGTPQSRDAIYGDDAIATTDFYTPLNLNERMKVVDGFLDTPRIVGGKEAVRYTRLENPSLITSGSEKATADTVDKIAEDLHIGDEIAEREREEQVPEINDYVEDDEVENIGSFDKPENTSATAEAAATEQAEEPAREVSMTTEQEQTRYREPMQPAQVAKQDAISQDPSREAASAERPWQYAARFLCKLSKREPVIDKPRVEPIKPREKVPTLRETEFFERAHGDIDKLFAAAERDDELCALLPEVEFVRVEFDGHVVSVGRAKEFLCYAVAGLYEKTSPLGEEAQWLPRVRSAPTGRGYWLVFQDINSGKILQS